MVFISLLGACAVSLTPVNTPIPTCLLKGQWGGWMRDKSGNLVTNSAMFHIKSRDQVYICSRYTTPYFGAMSQFSGWLQLPGMYVNLIISITITRVPISFTTTDNTKIGKVPLVVH